MKHHPDYTNVYRCSSRRSLLRLTQAMEELGLSYDVECRPGFYEVGYVGPNRNSSIESAWDTLLAEVNIGR